MKLSSGALDAAAARRHGLPPGSRRYETQLANGLRIAAAEVPGARMQRLVGAVGVGYLDEPDDCLGLAHLLEHALFLGSANCPSTDGFAHWVSARGGRYNAQTDESTTDVHLHLPPTDTAAGLARLVDMLGRPRFDLERIAHEVDVLDAEFHARLDDPALHRLAALGRLCHASHPARLCHAGNCATLGDDTPRLVERLAKFHAHYYRSGGMSLTLLGPLRLETQLELLIQHGAMLPAGEPSPPQRAWRWGKPAGVAWQPPSDTSTSTNISTDATSLELFWPLPDTLAVAHADRLAAVAARLANGQLAATLQAAVELDCCEVTLTPAGMGAALALRLSPTPSEAAVQIMLSTCRIALTQALASPLPKPPPVPVDLDAWPRQHARRLTSSTNSMTAPNGTDDLNALLAPKQCRLLWQTPAMPPGSKKSVTDTGTLWRPQPLPSESVVLSWRSPPTLDTPTTPRQTPSKIASASIEPEQRSGLWLGDPLRCPDASPANFCLGWPAATKHLAANLAQWQRNLLPLRQAAAANGLELICASDIRGAWLTATGSANKLVLLAELALAHWPKQPAPARDEMAQGLLAQRMLAQLETCPPIAGLSGRCTPVVGWISGDADTERAQALLSRLRSSMQEGALVPDNSADDAAGDRDLPPQGDEHAVMLEIAGPDDTPRSRWLLRLLGQCHAAAFYQEMRQRRGLGYVAAVRYREASGAPRLGYVVQSPHTAIGGLRQAITEFLAQHGVSLAQLSAAEMAQRKHGLLAHAGPPETHAEAIERVWQTLRRQAATGDTASPWQPLPWAAEAQALTALQADDLSVLAEELIRGQLPQRWWLHAPTHALN